MKFKFYTEVGITLWTGYTADSLTSLLKGLKDVPGSSIFYHLHHALFRRPRYTMSDYMNDFARWTLYTLGQKALAEKLSSVDPLQFESIRGARERLIHHVEDYVGELEVFMRVPKDQEFYFLELKSFVMPTGIEAEDLKEFIRGLKRLGRGTMLYHFIESRFRGGKRSNDFSEWLSEIGEEDLAQELEKLNPYLYDLNHLRRLLITILENRISKI